MWSACIETAGLMQDHFRRPSDDAGAGRFGYDEAMKNTCRTALLIALLTVSGFAFPQAKKDDQLLTAVCKGPTGTTLVMGKSRVMEPDGFEGGLFTYSWKVGSSTATIISQSGSAAGSSPSTEQATAVVSPEFVSFFVVYDRAVWMHSLFFSTKTVLISRHVSSTVANAPLGGVYSATCSVAVQ